MLRTLRAFAWLRWRMFVNSLERTAARDTLERFSLAVEKLGPVIAAVLMVPSGIALGALGVAAGYSLTTPDAAPLLTNILRFVLLTVPALCIAGPLLLPAGDRTNPVRMLLLPISRATMYVAQTAGTLGDPWTLLTIPVAVGLAIGVAAGGMPAAAILTFAAGLGFLLVVTALSALTTSIIHLVARDRRRGELLALIFIMVLPVVALLPGLLDGARPRDANGRRLPRTERRITPEWVDAAGRRAFAVLPSELYIRSARTFTSGATPAGTVALGGLAATALLLHAAGFAVFRRLLDSPGTTTSRRAARARTAWGRTLPLMSPPTSAVALAQVRLAFRTPRGRAILLSPVLMFALFSVMMLRNGGSVQFGPFAFGSGLGLAAFVCFISLSSILPIAMNQFAVDGAGLTLALLSPFTDSDYLRGKAVGNGIIGGLPAAVFVPAAAMLFPGGSIALWIALPLALLAVYLIVAPAAATFSAMFPRVVDMNSIGRGSNAHGAAGLLGLLAFVVAGVPCILLVLLATRWLERPTLAPVLLAIWCAAAFGISRVTFRVAERVFASRKENFAMLL